jgi:hypothetical protein
MPSVCDVMAGMRSLRLCIEYSLRWRLHFAGSGYTTTVSSWPNPIVTSATTVETPSLYAVPTLAGMLHWNVMKDTASQ